MLPKIPDNHSPEPVTPYDTLMEMIRLMQAEARLKDNAQEKIKAVFEDDPRVINLVESGEYCVLPLEYIEFGVTESPIAILTKNGIALKLWNPKAERGFLISIPELDSRAIQMGEYARDYIIELISNWKLGFGKQTGQIQATIIGGQLGQTTHELILQITKELKISDT